MPIITLLTDFGTQDSYVAEIKGVILSHFQRALKRRMVLPWLVDITHDIPAFDVARGAEIIGKVYRTFPRGTVHLAVVDPGVGGDRKPIIMQAAGQYFVGPDNGIFSIPAREDSKYKAHEITRYPRNVSSTFHGRDIFAPIAAALAGGEKPARFGPLIETITFLPPNYHCPASGRDWEGEIVSIDRFGNLITSFPGHLIQKMNQPCLKIKRTKISNFLPDYCHGTTGELCVIVNSHGHLEISIPNGSAQAKLRADKKCRIWLFEASISPASQKSQ